MARQKHRSQLDAIDEINMTPLIDLTFLLLIIFMITAPLLEYGINVSPPEKDAEKLPEDNSRIVNLNQKGEIVFNKMILNRDELIRELNALKNANSKLNILIRADGKRPYQEVIELMKTVEDAGIDNISLVTQAETK